ncbi:MAG: starch phosphorylase [Planctomycetota bacterium]|jgi:starch phosphorylase
MTPKVLSKRIEALALDLRWTWCPKAQTLFAAIDPLQWEATNHAPLEMLRRVSDARLEACADDPGMEKLLGDAEKARQAYYAAKTWFERSVAKKAPKLKVAYFCSEFAIHESLQQYSGGLGVLAGDHVKSVSDLGVPFVGVGLLYRHGYYIQELRSDGTTRVLYPKVNFGDLPIVDTGKEIECPLGGKLVRAKIWKQQVGRVSLYLLDADIEGEPKAHRQLTEGLYKGEPDLRLRQQVLLGVGGMMALAAVREKPTVIHLNEGHAAFASVERMRVLMEKGRSFDKALAAVKASTVFTTHTPVPAGHDRYGAKDVAKYLKTHLKALGLSAEAFADMAREVPGDREEPFCMTVLGLNTAHKVNGVAELHGKISREMWMKVYGAETSEEVPIGHVTNGIHARTWLAPEADAMYAKYIKPKWNTMGPDDDPWKDASKIPLADLWELRRTLRAKLVHFTRTRLARQAERRGEGAGAVAEAWRALDEDALTLGFARRFATYKRAPLIFKEAKRLSALLNDEKRPVQLIFAGKAHPRDEDGQELAKIIYREAHKAGFHGRVALIEEYDMQVGRMLTSGCDVWLNNPIRPNEASGTSGMKPPLHGGLNASILDGWWPEGYNGKNGWVIGDETEFKSRAKQDTYDAKALVEVLENDIVPLFYKRGKDGLPKGWLELARRSLVTVPGQFNSHRMVGDYVKNAYLG